MKLGIMLDVDETFTMIWLSRSSEIRVKVRRWPQSLVGTIFCIFGWLTLESTLSVTLYSIRL